MSDIFQTLAGRALSTSETAILPDQATRLARGVLAHPLLRAPAEAAPIPPLVAIDPNEDMA